MHTLRVINALKPFFVVTFCKLRQTKKANFLAKLTLKNGRRLLKFCQSVNVSPNLVTLAVVVVEVVVQWSAFMPSTPTIRKFNPADIEIIF